MEEIESNGIKIYPLPDCDSDEDEDYKEQVGMYQLAYLYALFWTYLLTEVQGVITQKTVILMYILG
jgi:septin 2